MKEYTAFQAALLDAVQEEYEQMAASQKKTSFRKALRRGLMAAAAVLVLAMGAVALAPFLFDVEHTVYTFPDTGNSNDGFLLSFPESIAAEDAPEWIETYYAPSILDNSQLVLYGCYLENREYGVSFHEGTSLKGEWTSLYLEWNRKGQQIIFSQKTTRSILPGQPFVNHQISTTADVAVDTYKLTRNGVEVFCFDMIRSEVVSRNWYWTDGDYLYELCTKLSVEEMEELFDSIAPITDFSVP